MNIVTLGKIITSPQGKDAIHIAVIPVIANEELCPGQHVAIVAYDNCKYTAGSPINNEELVGIIDPYLIVDKVKKGQECWLCLYPNTVTSLKHVWTHPAFPVPDVPNTSGHTPAQKASIKWLEDFASSNEISYDDLMYAAHDYITNSNYISQGSRWDGVSVPDIFWDHYEIITNEKTSTRGSFFACSC